MNVRDAVAGRRSVRSFEDRPVPRDAVDYAVSLAVQAPAPHHSAPWRFVLIEDAGDKKSFALEMGAAWCEDLAGDGLPPDKIEGIVGRSYDLLTHTPLLVVCCADLSKSHAYGDERRRLAEWSLFAHSVGAALQTFMLGLTERGISSCWISAPVFCREEVRACLGLSDEIEPQGLVLAGYADPSYVPRPRPAPDLDQYVLVPDSLCRRE